MLGGRVQMMISPYIVFRGQAEAGRVRILAVTSAERVPALPDVPTVAEAGGPAEFEAAGLIGIYAPAAVPRSSVSQIESAVAWALRDTDLPQVYTTQGLLPRFAGTDEFAAFIARERGKWRRIIREANITSD
jgi:tripartite-type tricarboxylate transporter receptor subunit TctC